MTVKKIEEGGKEKTEVVAKCNFGEESNTYNNLKLLLKNQFATLSC
jgi:hypothetical protein